MDIDISKLVKESISTQYSNSDIHNLNISNDVIEDACKYFREKFPMKNYTEGNT